MRDLIKNTTEIKIIASVFFTGEAMMYAIMAPFLGIYSISLGLIWQMAFISVILTAIQYIIYTSNLLSHIKTWVKILFHYASLVIIGYLWIKVFKWFDIDNIKNVFVALLVFTAWFLAFTGSIAIYNKSTGEQFNEKLKLYKNLKEK
ncbi:hypothetical protein [Clostridium sp.]|uniref:hypothetical protein n=1 Tax=Clostridium sp. TaxID=1506 RepID=UPI003217029E